MAERSFPQRAGRSAAWLAGSSATLLTLLIHAWFGDGRLPWLLALALGVQAALLSYGLLSALAARRLRQRPVIGAWRGMACALMVLTLVVATHAGVNPGAAGWLFSALGQWLAALLLFGWLALGLGAWMGRRLSAPRAEEMKT